MAGSIKRLALLDLTGTYTDNVYVPASALIYNVVRHIHFSNRDAAAQTFRLYLGATGANAAGTGLFFNFPLAANGAIGSTYDWYPHWLKLTSTTFLVGGASAATSITILINGEEYVVPS